MAMRHIESEAGLGKFIQDTDKEKAGLARAIVEGSKLWVARYGDIPLPYQTAPEKPATLITAEQRQNQVLLEQAIAELKKGFTPESVTNYWRAKLQIDGARVGLSIEVPDCDWTEEEIKRPMVDIKGNPIPGMMAYVPEQLKGKEGLILLGKMYPRMMSYSTRANTPTDIHNITGWIKVEATIGSPNSNTSQKELEDFAKTQEYRGQRESTYILASQTSKDLTGQYFDQGGTWSRLLRSRRVGYVIGAKFSWSGCLSVKWSLDPTDRYLFLGGRFEDVRRP